MSIADKLTTIAENEEKIYNAGRNSVVGDNRTNLDYWYQWIIGSDFDIFDYTYDEETEEEVPVLPEDDRGNWVNSLEYPTGTNKVTDFGYFFLGFREDYYMAGILPVTIPAIKFNGILDMSNARTTPASRWLGNKYTEDVGTIIFPKDGSRAVYAFENFQGLKHINVEEKIYGTVGFDRCPLTKESITSIINALSSSAAGKTATFNEAAKEAAFTDEEWAELIATKPNWKISLAT